MKSVFTYFSHRGFLKLASYLLWDAVLGLFPASPSFCMCPSLLAARFEQSSGISSSSAQELCWKSKLRSCENPISHRFSKEFKPEKLVNFVIIVTTSGICLLEAP